MREDTATILPSGEPDISIDSSKSLDISVQEASASISESTHEIPAADSDPETPPTPSGIGDHTLAIKAKSENEMFTSDLITAEDDVTVTASAAEEPQNEEIELTVSSWCMVVKLVEGTMFCIIHKETLQNQYVMDGLRYVMHTLLVLVEILCEHIFLKKTAGSIAIMEGRDEFVSSL